MVLHLPYLPDPLRHPWELCKRTAGSNQRKLQRLLNDVELGDRKPSKLLRHMCHLWCGGDTDETLLRELFMQRLPRNVCMVLAPSGTDVSLDNLAEMADRIMDVPTTTVAGVHAPQFFPPHTPPASTEIDSLRAEVRQLQDMVRSLMLYPRDSRRRTPTSARQCSPSPAHPPPT